MPGEFLQIQVFSDQRVADLKEAVKQATGTSSDSISNIHLIGRNTLVSIIREFHKRRYSSRILDKKSMSQQLEAAAASDSTSLSNCGAYLGPDDVFCLVDPRHIYELHELRGCK